MAFDSSSGRYPTIYSYSFGKQACTEHVTTVHCAGCCLEGVSEANFMDASVLSTRSQKLS